MISLCCTIAQNQCLVYDGYGDCVFRSATAACVRCGSTASFDAQAKQFGYMTWPDWLLCRLWPEYEGECRAFYAGTGKRFKARHPGLVRYIDGMMAACIAKSAAQAIADTPTRYKQQTRLFNGDWDDLSNTDGQNRFDSAEAAQADLDEMFEDLRYAAAQGHMEDGHDPADYRVVPVTGED